MRNYGFTVENYRLEDMADRIYRSAPAELFNDSTDMAHVIEWCEIYEHMESAIERCGEVPNVLKEVVLKRA